MPSDQLIGSVAEGAVDFRSPGSQAFAPSVAPVATFGCHKACNTAHIREQIRSSVAVFPRLRTTLTVHNMSLSGEP